MGYSDLFLMRLMNLIKQVIINLLLPFFTTPAILSLYRADFPSINRLLCHQFLYNRLFDQITYSRTGNKNRRLIPTLAKLVLLGGILSPCLAMAASTDTLNASQSRLIQNSPNTTAIPTKQNSAFKNNFGQNSLSLSPAISTNEPSLARILIAEFSADRGDMTTALRLYKQEAFHDNATAVFERGLNLSMANEDTTTAMNFANAWQQRHPEHIPALFYVTHLALKAHDYTLAGQKLEQILAYDPDADLSQILIGIYPTQPETQQELLATLLQLDTKANPSLLVMKAGLLLQFNQPTQALNQIDKALKKQPNTPAFITLKADILQKTAKPQVVLDFISNARKKLPDNKNLFLYQVRYLLANNDDSDSNPNHKKANRKKDNSEKAWRLLNSNPDFLLDDEIKLLTALVGLDIGRTTDADKLLNELTQNPDYRSQAYYYLGVSSERQNHTTQAIDYYGRVMQTDLVLTARKKQVDLLMANGQAQQAIASMEKLRADFDDFVPQSYLMQANILQKIGQTNTAIALLNDAQKRLPNNSDILFAKVLLLPEDDYANKRQLLQNILRLNPQNNDYQLEYAQILVNQKQDDDTVTAIASPLINNSKYGLKARQILAQMALHRQNYTQVASLLADNFDITPDVISGLLLHQAYVELHEPAAAQRIADIMQNELSYSLTTSR